MDLKNALNNLIHKKHFETVKDVPCDVLKQELKHRKEVAYQKRLQEANAKADKIDNLINEILEEYEGSEACQPKLEYVIAKHLFDEYCMAYSSDRYCRGSRYDEEQNEYRFNRFNRIQTSISHILSSPAAMRQLLMIYQENYRKHIISSIKEGCQ